MRWPNAIGPTRLGTSLALLPVAFGTCGPADDPAPPPVDAAFDNQIGGDYRPAPSVRIVSRDWFEGSPLRRDGGYTICYVNAFQTQDDERGVDRRDERSNWPQDLVLTEIGDDPNWGGEYLIDISTARRRQRAARHVAPMVETCARKGFDAVELDNLDSWTRFDGEGPDAPDLPFGRDDAVDYAELLTDHAHAEGLAVGQKNTPQLGRRASLREIGFDFAVAEQCGQHAECGRSRDVFGNRVIDIEYTDGGFERVCDAVGSRISVVRRDRLVRTPRSPRYVYDEC